MGQALLLRAAASTVVGTLLLGVLLSGFIGEWGAVLMLLVPLGILVVNLIVLPLVGLKSVGNPVVQWVLGVIIGGVGFGAAQAMTAPFWVCVLVSAVLLNVVIEGLIPLIVVAMRNAQEQEARAGTGYATARRG